MTKKAAIILAAGKGTRMQSDIPKVLHKVAGKTMLDWVVSAARGASIEKIVTVISNDAGEIKSQTNTEFAVQQNQLGTGDAVKSAADNLKDFDGDIAILCGDCPLVTPGLIDYLFQAKADNDVLVLGFETYNPYGYGRLITEQNKLLKIVEEKDASAEEKQIALCNAGVYIINAKLLFELLNEIEDQNAKNEFYLTDIVAIANAKKLNVTFEKASQEDVLGVNTKLELASAERIMQDRLRFVALQSGVTMIDPNTVYLSTDTKFGKNVTIKPNVVIGEDVEIGDNVTIGPFAHLRPGTRVGNGAKIGNFVEIKKSIIGDEAKISHLSYIGDSELGNNVNIGAGTITCNYDGYNKYQTKIEDDVFIGSNTALIAPVTVGKGSIVAAGSTIYDDVPTDAIGLARPEQKNLEDKAISFRKKKSS